MNGIIPPIIIPCRRTGARRIRMSSILAAATFRCWCLCLLLLWLSSSARTSLAFPRDSFLQPSVPRVLQGLQNCLRGGRVLFSAGFLKPGGSALRNGAAERTSISPSPSSDRDGWIMKRGMVFSSFSDGVAPNPQARRALRRGLVGAVLRQRQKELEDLLRSSVLHSPCAGPDIRVLNRLEIVDQALQSVYDCGDDGTDDDPVTILQECLSRLLDAENPWEGPSQGAESERRPALKLSLRLVYVPTAMYALRKDSASTPGKQRQRARADAKKRRDEICRLVVDLFSGRDSDDAGSRGSDVSRLRAQVSVDAVTLDWDDGSLKHVACGSSPSPPPPNGKHALAGWRPHLVYVQGGNTFWLHHCMEKGGWGPSVVDLLRDGSTYYCGSSAGAILAGACMDPATWKEWDDCSVVPGREGYEDWRDVPGLRLAGPHSFFPHMSEAWQPLVDRRAREMKGSGAGSGRERGAVVCLRDQDVCLVDGVAQSLRVVSSPLPAPALEKEEVAAAATL